MKNEGSVLSVIDLFSGSGILGQAFAEALHESLGLRIRTALYCERADYPQAVLLSRMLRGEIDSAPIHNDIRTLGLDAAPWLGSVFGIVGGWPCQGNSLAGSRKGMEDERSGLVVEVIRLVRLFRPSVIFLENVPGVLTAPGDGVGFVANALAQLGYDMRWTDLAASDVGQAHERQRFWLMAYHIGGERGRQPSVAEGDERHGKESGRDESSGEPQRCGEKVDLAQPRGKRREWGRGREQGRASDKIERPSYPLVPPGRYDDHAWEQVINLRLDVEPTLRRVASRLAFRADRIRVVGNGVDYVCAKAAAKALLEGI